MRDVTVSEVGPRDGRQMMHQVVPTATKLRWIAALHAAFARAGRPTGRREAA